MSQSEDSKLWTERLQRFGHADTTVAQFCAAEGVSQPAYYYWRRKLRGPASTTEPKATCLPAPFLPVALAPKADPLDSAPCACTTIELPGGIRIRIEVPTEPQHAGHYQSPQHVEDRS